MYTKKTYIVSGGMMPMGGKPRWVGDDRKSNAGWQNFIECKTIQHAVAQYNRLPRGIRQIDMRGSHINPVVVMYDK